MHLNWTAQSIKSWANLSGRFSFYNYAMTNYFYGIYGTKDALYISEGEIHCFLSPYVIHSFRWCKHSPEGLVHHRPNPRFSTANCINQLASHFVYVYCQLALYELQVASLFSVFPGKNKSNNIVRFTRLYKGQLFNEINVWMEFFHQPINRNFANNLLNHLCCIYIYMTKF